VTHTIEADPTTPRVFGHHVAGRSLTGPPLQRYAPATGVLVAEYADGSADDVDAAVRAAHEAFGSTQWQRTPAMARAELLDQLAALVAEHQEKLAWLDAQEVGKPYRFALGDLQQGVAHVKQAAAIARTLRGESFTGISPGYSVIADRRPVGVAGLILPWNFPALIALQKLPYALAAGCAVVVKPSEFTSSSALELARLVDAAGFPPGLVNVVTGTGPVVGSALVEHPLVRYVSFTGSTATGRSVLKAAADSVTRVGVELGGKTANVVLADADLDAAADGVVFGAFANQGESCVASSRLLVDRRVAKDVVTAVIERVGKLKVGLPEDPDADLGALIHPRHLDKVVRLVDAGIAAGAEVLLGGGAPAEERLAAGAFYQPTVVGPVDAGSPLFQEEVFGPVLSVTTFDNADEAIALANNTPYGLAHSLWTRDVERAFTLSNRLEAGTVWVNTCSDGSPAIPFGGIKGSGFGREAGPEGFNEFTEYRTVQFRTERR